MIDLNEVRACTQIVQLKLLLRCQQWQQHIPMDDLLAAKHQLMEFEGAIAVLIDIDLQCGVEGMCGQLIVIREGDNVVAQFLQCLERLASRIFTLVPWQRSFHLGMCVKQCPLPTDGYSVCRHSRADAIQRTIGVEDVRSFKRCRITEIVDRADSCYQYSQQDYKQQRRHDLEQKADHFVGYSLYAIQILHSNLLTL